MSYVWEVDNYCIILQASQAWSISWSLNHWSLAQIFKWARWLCLWKLLGRGFHQVQHLCTRWGVLRSELFESWARFLYSKWHPLLKLEEKNRSRIMRQLKHLHTQAPKQALCWKCWLLFPILLNGGFLKWWYPATMGFPSKNDHFEVFWGYHHLRKHPNRSDGSNGSRILEAETPEFLFNFQPKVDSHTLPAAARAARQPGYQTASLRQNLGRSPQVVRSKLSPGPEVEIQMQAFRLIHHRHACCASVATLSFSHDANVAWRLANQHISSIKCCLSTTTGESICFKVLQARSPIAMHWELIESSHLLWCQQKKLRFPNSPVRPLIGFQTSLHFLTLQQHSHKFQSLCVVVSLRILHSTRD